MSEAAAAPRQGTETRQRQRVVAVRCTDAEVATIEARAAQAGMTVGAYMRHQATGTAGPRAMRRPQVDRAALALVLARLGQFGSNLNQIARVANTTGEIDRWDNLPDALTAMLEMRDALMRALGRGD